MKATRNPHKLFLWLVVISVSSFALCIATFGAHTQPAKAASTGYWSMYMSGARHTGYNKAETTINPNTATNLKQHWSFQTGGSISTQPIEVNGLVYWGSWDGNEYAADLHGSKIWATYLGQTNDSHCRPTEAGVASTATVVNITIGSATSVVFVAGGDANFYALNASTGAILWHTPLGTPPATFIWSSPTYSNGNIYIGVSSFGDCPLVQGELVALNAVTGQITATFPTVPNGCTGAGVWDAPSIDQSTGALYFVTGNFGQCSSSEIYASSIVKLRVPDLSLLGYWPVPANEMGSDSDFGSTPTYFQATINGQPKDLVGVINKNGIFYAFTRAVSKGPVWTAKLASGGDCPQCGTGNISSAAWDGTSLYVATGNTTINGQNCQGSLQALDPATGLPRWRQCLNNGHVLAPVTAIPGVVIVTAGKDVIVTAAADGHNLTTLSDSANGSLYYGAVSISQGILYVGNMDGILHAYGL